MITGHTLSALPHAGVPGSALCVLAVAMAILLPARAQSTSQSQPAAAARAAVSAAPAEATRRSALRRPVLLTDKARTYYRARWGVDKLTVSYTSSGNLIRFTYRVEDAALAQPLVDKVNMPYLLGQRSGAVLQVPVMEKVGPLRQTNDLKAGKEYWVVFSNKGNLVRPGDRVNVMIGAFHADGLLVE